MLFYVFLAFLANITLVSASNGFDFGDTLALILGLFMSIMGFFACMGAYSRKKSNLEAL